MRVFLLEGAGRRGNGAILSSTYDMAVIPVDIIQFVGWR
jgi:hypothetical protein